MTKPDKQTATPKPCTMPEEIYISSSGIWYLNDKNHARSKPKTKYTRSDLAARPVEVKYTVLGRGEMAPRDEYSFVEDYRLDAEFCRGWNAALEMIKSKYPNGIRIVP